MPRTTIVDIPPTEQAQRLAEVRRARYGYLLVLHMLLLCAAQRTPTEIAAVLFCSRTTVYRVVQAYRTGQWAGLAEAEAPGLERSPRRVTVLSPALKRSVVAILHSVPRLCGWCRTRWSCATIAVELYTRRSDDHLAGLLVSERNISVEAAGTEPGERREERLLRSIE